MKKLLLALTAAALAALAPALAAQKARTAAPAPTAVPSTQGLSATTTTAAPPPGAKPAEIQDLRLLVEAPDDPYEYERLGYASVQANELGRAREFFQMSWKTGELPTAAYNLACLDARAGKADAAFKQLDVAITVGFDDEKTLLGDSDMNPLRGDPRFSKVVAGARRNRAAGDAAVVTDGIFVAPQRKAGAILIVLHDASSDPLTASSPFTNEARARGLFLASPRGPARAGKRRFGWGTAERAYAAVDAAVEAGRKKAGNPSLPVLLVGVGRGGTLAYSAAARKPGVFAAVGSLGGPFDPGGPGSAEAAAGATGLQGVRLFLGVPRDASPNLLQAIRRGRETLKKAGFSPGYAEWPGGGTSFPKDVAAAVKETLDSLIGSSASSTRPAAR